MRSQITPLPCLAPWLSPWQRAPAMVGLHRCLAPLPAKSKLLLLWKAALAIWRLQGCSWAPGRELQCTRWLGLSASHHLLASHCWRKASVMGPAAAAGPLEFVLAAQRERIQSGFRTQAGKHGDACSLSVPCVPCCRMPPGAFLCDVSVTALSSLVSLPTLVQPQKPQANPAGQPAPVLLLPSS